MNSIPVILHACDHHIGFRQYGMKVRLCDFDEALVRLVDLALERQVTAVVFPGDFLHSSNPDPASLLLARYQISRLQEDGISVFGIEGNHDDVVKLEDREGSWIELVGIQRTKETIITVGKISLRMVLKDWMPSSQIKEELQRLREAIKKGSPRPDILVLHQSCAEFMPSVARPLAEICLNDLHGLARYVLMGDIHENKTIELKLEDGTPQYVAYAGSAENTSIAEPRQKMINLVSFPSAQEIKIEQVLIPSREVVDLQVGRDQTEALQTVHQALQTHKGEPLFIIHYDPTAAFIRDQAVEMLRSKGKSLIHTTPDKTKSVNEEDQSEEGSSDMIEIIQEWVTSGEIDERVGKLAADLWCSSDNLFEILDHEEAQLRDEMSLPPSP